MESRTIQGLDLNLPNPYHPQLKEWVETLVAQEIEALKGHNFGNVESLLGFRSIVGLLNDLFLNRMLQIEPFDLGQPMYIQQLKNIKKLLESSTT